MNTRLSLAAGYSVRDNTNPPTGFIQTDTLTTPNRNPGHRNLEALVFSNLAGNARARHGAALAAGKLDSRDCEHMRTPAYKSGHTLLSSPWLLQLSPIKHRHAMLGTPDHAPAVRFWDIASSVTIRRDTWPEPLSASFNGSRISYQKLRLALCQGPDF
jgi:hypothetical protein